MMGLVGNVAEVKHLRNRLMKSEFISVFSNLLDSDSDGIEVNISCVKSCAGLGLFSILSNLYLFRLHFR